MKVKGYMYPQMKKPVGMLPSVSCTPFDCASGCTLLLQGVKISISMDRNVNNL
jgi:hypothetical protein